MPTRPTVVATRDDVVVEVLSTADAGRLAADLLDTAAEQVGGPVVDEAERERLEALATSTGPQPERWDALLAARADTAVGYAGLVQPGPGGGTAVGDLAPVRSAGDTGPVLAALLDAVRILAVASGSDRLEVWLRQATAADVAAMGSEGFEVVRRLTVLGRDLGPADIAAPTSPTDVEVRGFRPESDVEAVVDLLARAYEGTPDGGWDLARFRAVVAREWFRPDDLLVAEDRGATAGALAGLHWLKRRSATVGEVYNLAVHPDAQGRGLGPLLLSAGLAHLAATGCTEVVLWVDTANEGAATLYRSHGFLPRWDDVCFAAALEAA